MKRYQQYSFLPQHMEVRAEGKVKSRRRESRKCSGGVVTTRA
jgi:hypothetical protein